MEPRRDDDRDDVITSLDQGVSITTGDGCRIDRLEPLRYRYRHGPNFLVFHLDRATPMIAYLWEIDWDDSCNAPPTSRADRLRHARRITRLMGRMGVPVRFTELVDYEMRDVEFDD